MRSAPLLLLALTIATPALRGQSVSSFTDLGTLGGNVSYAYGINHSGQVVGGSTVLGVFPMHAFLYSGGVMTDIYAPTSIGDNVSARGLNNSGQVIVDFHQVQDTSAGVVTFDDLILSPGNFGKFQYSLGSLGAPYSYGYGVNSSGQAAGYSLTFDAVDHAFLHTTGSADFHDNGNMTDLGTLGGANSYAYGLNDSGQVVGASELNNGFTNLHAFLYSGGVMTDLGAFDGANSQANGINASGQIAGWSTVAGDLYPHAFLYANGTMTDLGTLGTGLNSQANGLNAAGMVVGNSTYTVDVGLHAFLYADGTMYDLNTLAAPFLSDGSVPGFLSLDTATAINDLGQIIGQGTYLDAGGATFDRAYLLTVAIPEPATGAIIFGLGVIGLALRRRAIREKIISPSSKVDPLIGQKTRL